MRRIVDFVSGFATEVTAAASKVVLEAIRDRLPTALATDRLKVDGSGVTQPVSGTVAISGTPTISGAVTVTSGAITETNSAAILAKIIAAPATEAKQDTGNTSLATLAGIVSAGKALVTETSAAAILAKFSAGQAARASSLGVTLSTEDAAKVPSLGQALAANSVPVVLTAIQIAQLAQDATLTGGTQIAIAKGAAATGAAVSGNPVYVGGKDGSGNAQPVLVNASGMAQVSAAKGTSVSSTAAEASHVISASACLVSRASMQNGNAATRYMQLHNTTSLPSNGAVPVSTIIIGTTQTQVTTFSIPTDKFSTGCVVATSTTGATLTIGSADALFTVDLFPTNV